MSWAANSDADLVLAQHRLELGLVVALARLEMLDHEHTPAGRTRRRGTRRRQCADGDAPRGHDPPSELLSRTRRL